MRNLLIVSILLFCFFSCKQTDTSETKTVQTLPQKEHVAVPVVALQPVHPEFDHVASLLSGQPADTTFETLRKSTAFKTYSNQINSIRQDVYEKRLIPMRQWAAHEYDSLISQSDTLFYPFSGPDFLNAFTLFPATKTFILIALEPIGILPAFPATDTLKWKACFNSLQLSLQDIYKKSYFITKRMNEHLGGQKAVYGTLPLLAVFLKQTGHRISDIQAIRLDTAGNLVEFPYDTLASSKSKPKGVKISFYAEGDTALHQLYYFSADLGDGALKPSSRFRKFLNKMGSFHAYAKSASYLMHYNQFSIIRNHVLAKARLLLQDDTGIAFRFIDSSRWGIHLYGQYVPPVKDFSAQLFQKDLKQQYKKDSARVKPLSFELGYHWGSKKNNLMLFVKK